MRSLFSCHFFHCNVLRRCIHLHSQPSVITSAPSCFFGNNVDTIRQSNSCALHCIGVTSRRLLWYLLFLTLIPATVCSCLRSCLRFVSSSPLISAVVFAQRSNRIRTHTLLSSCETGLVSVAFVSVPPSPFRWHCLPVYVSAIVLFARIFLFQSPSCVLHQIPSSNGCIRSRCVPVCFCRLGCSMTSFASPRLFSSFISIPLVVVRTFESPSCVL